MEIIARQAQEQTKQPCQEWEIIVHLVFTKVENIALRRARSIEPVITSIVFLSAIQGIYTHKQL